MDLTVKDMADALQVPTTTVYRWISDKDLPAQKVKEQYYCNRGQLLEWAAINQIPVGPKIFRDEKGNRYSEIGFTQSLESGGIFFDLPGTTKEQVLRAVVERLPGAQALDREMVLQLFFGAGVRRLHGGREGDRHSARPAADCGAGHLSVAVAVVSEGADRFRRGRRRAGLRSVHDRGANRPNAPAPAGAGLVCAARRRVPRGDQPPRLQRGTVCRSPPRRIDVRSAAMDDDRRGEWAPMTPASELELATQLSRPIVSSFSQLTTDKVKDRATRR